MPLKQHEDGKKHLKILQKSSEVQKIYNILFLFFGDWLASKHETKASRQVITSTECPQPDNWGNNQYLDSNCNFTT